MKLKNKLRDQENNLAFLLKNKKIKNKNNKDKYGIKFKKL
jgi:hypothetical protein